MTGASVTALLDEIEELAQRIAARLWSLKDEGSDRPGLIYPTKRDGMPRVSEQEARILTCLELEKSATCYYSVETPTVETYVQSGQSEISARIDVTIYDRRNPSARIANVEFKAHNPRPESFRKDLEKLIREGLPGLWFHTIERTDRRTLPAIMGKLSVAFEQLKQHMEGRHQSIVFAFCILDRKKALILHRLSLANSIESELVELRKTLVGESQGKNAQ